MFSHHLNTCLHRNRTFPLLIRGSNVACVFDVIISFGCMRTGYRSRENEMMKEDPELYKV